MAYHAHLLNGTACVKNARQKERDQVHSVVWYYQIADYRLQMRRFLGLWEMHVSQMLGVILEKGYFAPNEVEYLCSCRVILRAEVGALVAIPDKSVVMVFQERNRSSCEDNPPVQYPGLSLEYGIEELQVLHSRHRT